MAYEIPDVALIFEGGGMRNSYSSGVVNVLLENEIFFKNVYGLSAGATNAVNYLSRDKYRSRESFTDYLDDFSFRRWMSFLLGIERWESGGDAAKGGKRLPVDFETFQANLARLTLQAVERDSGKSVYFTDGDLTSVDDLMKRVRASSSYPIIMSPTWIDGKAFYDGGIGEGGGIMIPRAEADGLKKYFVIRTRPRGYRKPLKKNRLYSIFFWHRPAMRHLLDSWAQRYNREVDMLERLETEGRAYVFYSESQSVKNTEQDVEKLRKNFQKGYEQAQSELSAWMEFLA